MKRTKMIGAHTPQPATKRRPHLYSFAKEFNAAFRAWTRRAGRTHLASQLPVARP